MDPGYLRAEQFGPEHRSRITLLICDMVGIDAETWLSAKTQTIRILSDAGVDVAWTDADGRSRLCTTGAIGSYFTVVILARPPTKRISKGALGAAVVRTGPYPRAYVFYDQTRIFVGSFELENQKTSVGVILGHAIAHELGHLLIPGDAHGKGIMREQWTSADWRDAVRGHLLFHRDHARQIHEALRPK